MSDKLIRDIPDSEIAARQPVSEVLMQKLRDNPELLEAAIFNVLTGLLAGAVDSVVAGTITDADPTSKTIQHDDQFIGRYLHFTDGGAFTANSLNRFKITSTSKTLQTLTVAQNLVTEGVVAGDLYVIEGHTHDGTATNPDGARVDLKDLANIKEDKTMTQDLSDAITDPDGNRSGTANKATPFATTSDIVLAVPAGTIILWDTSSACPTGFTKLTALDDRFPQGVTGTPGGTGGSSTHKHTNLAGPVGGWASQGDSNVSFEDHLPPFYEVIFCKKD